MRKMEMRNAILQIAHLLTGADPSWCVYGSSALVLNGVPGIGAHDVDILMSAGGVRRLMCCLPQVELLTDERAGSRFRSLHARVYIEGVEIDLSGDLQLLQGGEWTPVTIGHVCQWQDIRFASLPDCLRLLRQFDRPKDLVRLELVEAACGQGLCGQPSPRPDEP